MMIIKYNKKRNQLQWRPSYFNKHLPKLEGC